MIRYVVTTIPGETGAYLSKVGSWGNIPHTSAAAAREAARTDADGEEHEIRQHSTKQPKDFQR